jgi:probable rRNA maturation factor
MKKTRTGISVDIIREYEPFRMDWTRLKDVVRKAAWQSGVRKGTMAIRVTDDAGISCVNMRYLRHRGPTDVISFDLSEEMGVRAFDLVVNAQRAAKEAHSRGHTGEAELALYVVHGLLHCLGFDDMKKKDAHRMHEMEDNILRRHGYGTTYGRK